MRWKLKAIGLAKQQWHHWFAWYPVWLSDIGEYAWLETVWRSVTHENHSCCYQHTIKELAQKPLRRPK